MKQLVVSVIILMIAQFSFAAGAKQEIPLTVTEKGFDPSEIKVTAGSHVVLRVTRKTEQTCATNIVLKEKKIKKELPLNKEVIIDVGVLKNGKITFACGMDMISGHIVAE